jgi:hypothetical protein
MKRRPRFLGRLPPLEDVRQSRMPLAGVTVRRCRVCGCTDDDCRQCVERTGQPYHWIAQDLCSACDRPAA